MKFNPEACSKCDKCDNLDKCPTDAFIVKNEKILAIDRSHCFNCGNCVISCPQAFKMDLKSIKLDDTLIPVVLRQSDRNGAVKLAEQLKSMILNGEFPLKKPISKLQFAKEVK
jgi:Fe-S-cluster-containing dehydrogenase component